MLSAAYASFPQEGRQTRMQLLSEGLKSLPPHDGPACASVPYHRHAAA